MKKSAKMEKFSIKKAVRVYVQVVMTLKSAQVHKLTVLTHVPANALLTCRNHQMDVMVP